MQGVEKVVERIGRREDNTGKEGHHKLQNRFTDSFVCLKLTKTEGYTHTHTESSICWLTGSPPKWLQCIRCVRWWSGTRSSILVTHVDTGPSTWATFCCPHWILAGSWIGCGAVLAHIQYRDASIAILGCLTHSATVKIPLLLNYFLSLWKIYSSGKKWFFKAWQEGATMSDLR